MPKQCVQLVQNMGMIDWKTCVSLSTNDRFTATAHITAGAKLALVRSFPHIYTQLISTAKIALSPLFEHYFYPVSTMPTITNTK